MFATFGVQHYITGAVLALALALVIIGGIKRIAKVTERLVPFMAIIYFIGALVVLISNYENFVPSLLAVFSEVFTGTAAIGGFLGAGFAFAFNNGVNRGLFSNEPGQGSAPIAHAAARAHEPVSEGMVAILEPFVDTIIICMLTGMVLISTGSWHEKHDNVFQNADMQILAQKYDEQHEEDLVKLKSHLNRGEKLALFSGLLTVENGEIVNELSVIHARSLAEQIIVKANTKELFSGQIEVANGTIKEIPSDVVFTGKSLLHSAPLTNVAFSKSALGRNGELIVTFGLLLFAFSTAIAWSYYGDRAVTYLFGVKWVLPYRIIYVLGFFIASFVDTTIVWNFSMLTIAFMAVPNLIGLLILHREIKSTIKNYWRGLKKEYPDEKILRKY